jgi:hypothetical protein
MKINVMCMQRNATFEGESKLSASIAVNENDHFTEPNRKI